MGRLNPAFVGNKFPTGKAIQKLCQKILFSQEVFIQGKDSENHNSCDGGKSESL